MSNRALGLFLLCCLPLAGSSADVIDGEELFDPTRPLMPGNLSETNDASILDMIRNVIPTSFEVTFIRAGSSSSIAIINDRRVTIGDTIGGATVLEIDRSGVTLLIDDQEMRVSMYNTGIKSPAVDL